jgi:hypothetical protein
MSDRSDDKLNAAEAAGVLKNRMRARRVKRLNPR